MREGRTVLVYHVPFPKVALEEVAADLRPFIAQINELLRSARLIERVMQRIKLRNPARPHSMVTARNLPSVPLGDLGETGIALATLLMEMYSSQQLMSSLRAKAICAVAPEYYRRERDAYVAAMTSRGHAWFQLFADDSLGLSDYLDAVREHTQIEEKWFAMYDSLASGAINAQWLANRQLQGSRKGGLASGRSRKAGSTLTPADVSNEYSRLLGEGKSPRDIAAIIAARHRVTADYVRKLRRATKGSDALGD